ncbi:hypothetical protein LSAT2_030794 [Lamellibrachia satsuma]|nr:hypothetical protein LSAT2_030794 [Lamellibrachia satsuma]
MRKEGHPRSYIVTREGRQYRRNRRHLMNTAEKQPETTAPVDVSSDAPQQLTHEDARRQQTPPRVFPTQAKTTPTPQKTSRGRIIRRPLKLAEYVASLFVQNTRRLEEAQEAFFREMESLLNEVVSQTGLPLLQPKACAGHFSRIHTLHFPMGQFGRSVLPPGESMHLRWGDIVPVVGVPAKLHRTHSYCPTWNPESTVVHDTIDPMPSSRHRSASINTPHLLEFDINQSQRLAQRVFNRLRFKSKYPLIQVNVYDMHELPALPTKATSPATQSYAVIANKNRPVSSRLSLHKPLLPAKLSVH